jgi:predicted metalloprotease with PDZ domain
VAATSTTGWEDCLNAHIFRAIDLRVRPQQDAVERELRISAALQAGLGMIRVVDAAMTGFDRSRGFYQKFTDYYPTLLESLVGLEARVRVERARLGLKVTATGSGIRIDEILKGYSAEQSDLKVGDVIVEAELRPVLTEEGLASIVQSLPLGKTIEVVVERQGKRLTLPVTLSKGRTEYEFFRPATPDLQTGQPAGSGSG